MGSKSSKAKAKSPVPPTVLQTLQKEDSDDSTSSKSSGSVICYKDTAAAAASVVPVYIAPTPPPFVYKGREINGLSDSDNGEFIIEVGMFGRPYWMSPERISQSNHLTALPAVPNVNERLARIRAESSVDIIDEHSVGRGSYQTTREGFIDNNGPVAIHRLGQLDLEDKDDLRSISQLLAFLSLDIQHPNLNPATKLCVEGRGGFIFISPLCMSTRLEDIITNVRLTEPEMAHILKGVLLGLQYLHSRGLAHTEVSAHRVYFARNTLDVRLLMKFASLVCAWHDKSDIWALGITLYEMLEGKPPYADLHPMRALFLIPKNDSPVPEHPDRWSAELLSFLASCLQKDPSLRPTTDALLEHPFIAKACNREEFCRARRSCIERPAYYGNHLSIVQPQKLA